MGANRFTDRDWSEAERIERRAQWVSSQHATGQICGSLIVPRRWVMWLLMRRAGVPIGLVAKLEGLDVRRVRRCVRVVIALQIYPPFAAQLERGHQAMSLRQVIAAPREEISGEVGYAAG